MCPALAGFPSLNANGTNLRRQPSLRSQLNQIRMWVRQGRTDAWIAHKLDVSVDELARFKREHALDGGDEGTRSRPADPLSVPPPEPPSYDLDADEEEEEDEGEDEDERRPERSRRRSRRSRSRRPVTAGNGEDDDDEDLVAVEEPDEEDEEPDRRPRDRDTSDADDQDGAPRPRRRRGRRGGRRHRPRGTAYEATFDHGGEGYGLWLDPAVADNPVYSEHWAGHRAVTVTVEPEAITIRRAGASRDPDADAAPGSGEDEDR
jgi:hypothetical protein